MIENKYDDETFFAKYSAFPRSVHGLKAAGEWHELKKLLPDFAEKRVLDLGCGFGWHCFYAAGKNAENRRRKKSLWQRQIPENGHRRY